MFLFFISFFSVKDKSGRAVSALLEKHDISKFGKLMSAIVLKTWPRDANGEYIEGEDLIFEYLVKWPMAKTVFQMTGNYTTVMLVE